MAEPTDIEVILRRRDNARYTVELRGTSPENDVEVRPFHGQTVPLQFDFDQLLELFPDPTAYGRALGAMLFADPLLAAEIAKARAEAYGREAALRRRIALSPPAAELHALRWETLRDPQALDQALLTTDEQVLFSRYIASPDWQPVRLQAREALRALVVIANPSNLTEYKPAGRQLAPVDVEGELARATAGLGTIPVTPLCSSGAATLDNLIAHVREGYDILYLVCHGALINGEPWLWLENEQGAVARVSGGDLVTRLHELRTRPRLVVLVSCQSAGTGEQPSSGDNGELAALGPQLAEAGIPAVIAMQGNISMQTVAEFMPIFFKELQRDGQIDRALAVARGRVRDRADFWMPVLFMRLKSGRIWYVPGFAGDQRGRAEEKWVSLMASIREGQCTPILGPDLAEELIGPRRDLARALAEDFHFPLAPHNREDLPQVAQFLAVDQSLQYLPHAIIQYLCAAIRRRQGQDPPAAQDVDLKKATRKELLTLLETLLNDAWRDEQTRNPSEPYRVLARLPAPIYLTTNPSDLLVEALRDQGKIPEVMFCPWNTYTEKAASPFTKDPDYDPSPQQPLVYRLFGSLQEPESLVLTEDNHFDYLIGVTQYKDLIPTRVRSILADTALLFLGFRPDDWSFRVFFRSLMSQAGGERRSHYAHIAVQVALEEGRMLLPKLAQRFLEDYFSKGADISVYWGSSKDFARELDQRL